MQQSLPQRLLGGHWLTEKFQFLSTLAWQSGDDEGGILGELDLVVPLYGKRNTAGADQYGFFLQPGLVSWEADNGDRRLDVNVGLVYRQRLRERIALGAAVFYDHNIDSDLKRIGAAADWVSPYTYVAVNYYEPISGWRSGERLGYEERALRGVDINIEQALLDSGWVLEASGGYWKGYDADKRKGEWQPAGSVGIRYYPLDYLSVYADYAYHHKDVDTERFVAGIEFSYPGKYRGVSENEIDLWRPVKREKRILYAERKIYPTNIRFTSPLAQSIDIDFGNPVQLPFTVGIDRPLSADLRLQLVFERNGAEVRAANGESRLTNGGIVIIPRGQTQKQITYDSNALFRGVNPASGDQYHLRLADATLVLPGEPNVKSGISNTGGQVILTVGEVTSQIQFAAFNSPDFRQRNPALQVAECSPQGRSNANELGCVSVRRPLTGMSILNIPIRPGSFSGDNLMASFTTNSTAMAGSDYNLLTSSLTWTAAEAEAGTYKNIRIEVLPSTPDDEALEFFRILADIQIDGEAVAFPGCTDRNGNQADACVRVELPKTPTLTLPSNPTDVAGGGTISLEVSSDIAVAGTLMLPLTISGQVAAADFSSNTLTPSVNANFNGGRTATVTIGTVRDGDAPETYTIRLGSGSNYRVGSDATATGTIGMATPSLTLATDPAAVIAGNDISLVVTSDVAFTGMRTLPLTISGSGITAADFSGNTLTPSVSANFNGGRTATVTIGTEKIGGTTARIYTITLGSGTDYTVGSDPAASGTINRATAVLTLATDPAAVIAGNTISLVVTSDIPVAGSLTVALTFSGQVAASDLSGNTLTPSVSANFNGNQTATVTIATVRDTDTTAETYTITLGSGTGYTVGSDPVANSQINPFPTLSLVTLIAPVTAGNAISLVVTSNVAIAGTLTLSLSITSATVGITASDFTNGLSQMVRANFNGGRMATVLIGTVADGDARIEAYTIRLNSGSDYTVVRGINDVINGLIRP